MTQPAKHTPGPWYAANMGNDFQGLVVEEQTGKNIAVAYDKRDVHILAAAPAMYEALRVLTSEINLSTLNVRKDFSLMNAHACAVKAILQAEGKLL